ncbi:hypothetical protein CJH86_05420 [Salmonella enterica]|nr:hypothetical protein [Salmonella enterica]EIL8050633.1 hypothetical protein [Salmonella enterica]
MANYFDQFDEPKKGAKAPKQSNYFDQFDETEAPAPTTTKPEQDNYENGTGIGGAISGVVRGVPVFAGHALNFLSDLPGQIAQTGSEIKHQYDTGTLFTPEFQQASVGGKIQSLAGGVGTGLAETGRAIAQQPNTVINTLGALYDSVAANPVGGNDVDIYSALPDSIDQALKPKTAQGKTLENTVSYLVPGGAVAEAAKVHAMSVKSLSDRGIPLTSENIAQEDTKNMLLLATGGLAMKTASKAANVASEIPGALTGRASLKTTARALGDTTENLYQGGDVGGQQVYRDMNTDAAGNYTAPASGSFRGEGGAGFRQAETRKGSFADRQAAAQEQTRANVQQTVDDISGPNGANAQEAVGQGVEAFTATKNKIYTDSMDAVSADMKSNGIARLKMNDTRDFANNLLKEDQAYESYSNPVKKVISKIAGKGSLHDMRAINEAKISIGRQLSDINLNPQVREDLLNLRSRLLDETDATVKQFSPETYSVFKEGDAIFREYVDPLGKKSKAAKIADKDNYELAANQLVGGSPTARGNAANVSDTLRKVQQDERFTNGADIAANFSEGMGNTARQRAQEAAERAYFKAEDTKPGSGNAAYTETFNKTLGESRSAMRSVGGLGARNEAQINQALIDAVNDSAVQMVKPSNVVSGLVNLASKKIPGLSFLTDPVSNFVGGTIDTLAMRGMREQAIRNTAGRAMNNPEELEQMYRAYRDSLSKLPKNGIGVSPAIAASQDTNTPDSRGMVTITLPPQSSPLPTMTKPAAAAPEFNPEPAQKAQAAKKSTPAPKPLQDKGVNSLYGALREAETGGESDPYIRTKAAEGGKPSSAFGPLQITRDLMKDFYANESKNLSESERDYVKRFIAQGDQMLKAKADDPKYGYGKAGDLGSPADRKMYDIVGPKILKMLVDRNGNSLNKTVKSWRGKYDAAYARKVRSAFVKRQGWHSAA